MTGEIGTIYLLCFDRPLHHARHYVGWCQDDEPSRRVQEHLEGRGSPLVRAVVEAGIGVQLVRTWRGTRTFEREIKDGKSTTRHCPRCLEDYNRRARERMRRRRRGEP